jgi:hypothetical protein
MLGTEADSVVTVSEDDARVCQTCTPDHLCDLAMELHTKTPFDLDSIQRRKQAILMLFPTVADTVNYIRTKTVKDNKQQVTCYLLRLQDVSPELSAEVESARDERTKENVMLILGFGTARSYVTVSGGCWNWTSA